MDDLTYCNPGLNGNICLNVNIRKNGTNFIEINSEGYLTINLLKAVRTHETPGYCEEHMVFVANMIAEEEEVSLAARRQQFMKA